MNKLKIQGHGKSRRVLGMDETASSILASEGAEVLGAGEHAIAHIAQYPLRLAVGRLRDLGYQFEHLPCDVNPSARTTFMNMARSISTRGRVTVNVRPARCARCGGQVRSYKGQVIAGRVYC